MVARQLYDAWGNVRYVTGTLPTDIGFTSQRLDTTGLYFFQARFYDASLGRFLSADTIVPNSNNPQSFNRYTYVGNNPVKRIDPSGHVECNGALSDGVTNCTQATQADRRSADIAAYHQMVQYKIEHDTCCSNSWKYREEITAIANAYGIPPILLAAAADHQSHSKNRPLEPLSLAYYLITGEEFLGEHSYGITQIRPSEFAELAGLSSSEIERYRPYLMGALIYSDPYAINAMARKIQIADQRCSGCSESTRYAVMAIAQNGWGPKSINVVLRRGIYEALHQDVGAWNQALAIQGDMVALTERGWSAPSGVLDNMNHILLFSYNSCTNPYICK